MKTFQSKTKVVAVVIVCGLLVLAMILLREAAFQSRWHDVKAGMSEAEVRQALGTPTRIGDGQYTGADGRKVTRWEFRRNQVGRITDYCVDFDYIGPAGTPLVCRTESFSKEWDWPSWWPWRKAKAKA